MSFLTCFCDLPQNEHFNSSPVSPNLATVCYPSTVQRVVRFALSATAPHCATSRRIMRGPSRHAENLEVSGSEPSRSTASRDEITVSMMPYSSASLASMTKSRSVSSVDALDWLTRVPSKNAVQNLTHSQNLVCGEFKIGDLPVPDLA